MAAGRVVTAARIDLEALLDALAERVAERLATRLRPAAPEYYDQRTAPVGRRAFLEAARQGAFPAFRVGKRVLARRVDFEQWLESRRREPPALAADPDALLARAGLRATRPKGA